MLLINFLFTIQDLTPTFALASNLAVGFMVGIGIAYAFKSGRLNV